MEMNGITRPPLKRLARRAGVRSMSEQCAPLLRQLVALELNRIMRFTSVVNQQHNTKTVMIDDLYNALQLMGINVAHMDHKSKKTDVAEDESKKNKKKFRYYDSYISKVLKDISPENGITSNAKNQLNSVLITLSRIITNYAENLTEFSGKKTLSIKEIEGAVSILLDSELQECAINEGNKAVNKFENKSDSKSENIESGEKGCSRQTKAGIIFPPSVAEKFLRKFDNSIYMITQNGPVYFAAVLEYICMEILASASTIAKENSRVRITVKDLELSIQSDKELNSLFKKNKIEFLGGGNIPFIHPFLSTKKPGRFKSGTVAIREIKKYQRLGNTLLFPKNPFEKFVRIVFKNYRDNVKISKNVFLVLQYVVEQYLVRLLSDANNAAIHANRIKLMPIDIDFVKNLHEKTKNIPENLENSIPSESECENSESECDSESECESECDESESGSDESDESDTDSES